MAALLSRPFHLVLSSAVRGLSATQSCVTSTLHMAAAPCDCRVRRGFRGSAGGPPVTQPAPLSLASPFTTPLLGRVLPLGSLRALACSLLAVSSALAPYLLFQLPLCSLKLSLPWGSLFCPGPGSRCQQRTPRYTAPSAQVSLSSEPGCGRCGSFPPVCSGWLGAGVQTAVWDWCVDGWGLVCGWTAVPGPLTEAGGSFWASPPSAGAVERLGC